MTVEPMFPPIPAPLPDPYPIGPVADRNAAKPPVGNPTLAQVIAWVDLVVAVQTAQDAVIIQLVGRHNDTVELLEHFLTAWNVLTVMLGLDTPEFLALVTDLFDLGANVLWHELQEIE